MKRGQIKADESKTATVRKHRGFAAAAESSHTAGVSLAMLKCGMREQRKKFKTGPPSVDREKGPPP